VGEVGDEQLGLEILGQYTSGDDLMHMCYAFELLSGDKPTAQYIKDVMDKVDEVARDGWACWAYSNHDVMRHPSRWQLTDDAARMFTTLMMCLKGSACIYQGEELGLPEADVAYEDLQDPYGIEFWPEFKGRDGCRTPMVWESSNQNGGFSDAAQPWLPVSPDHLASNVALSEADEGSILHHYRRAIALRQDHAALKTGTSSPMSVDQGCLVFTRSGIDEELYCVFNLTDQGVTLDAPAGDWVAIDSPLTCASPMGGTLNLGPWQPCILHRKLT
jgi:alpha-glucosidase